MLLVDPDPDPELLNQHLLRYKKLTKITRQRIEKNTVKSSIICPEINKKEFTTGLSMSLVKIIKFIRFLTFYNVLCFTDQIYQYVQSYYLLHTYSKTKFFEYVMSLVAHQFGRVEFRILTIFSSGRKKSKQIFKIQHIQIDEHSCGNS